MKSEYDALLAKNTWSLVPRPSDYNVIGNKWVYRIKWNLDSLISHYKARLVAKGFNQQYRIDCGDTFSLVVKATTIHIILALDAVFNWHFQ